MGCMKQPEALPTYIWSGEFDVAKGRVRRQQTMGNERLEESIGRSHSPIT